MSASEDLEWEVLPPEEKERRAKIEPLIGLIPGIGDTSSAFVSALVPYSGSARGPAEDSPGKDVAQYLLNELIGIIPGIGDAFSFGFKSNRRNYELLQGYSGHTRKATKSDWAFVIVILVFLTVIVATGIAVSFYVLSVIARFLRGR